MTDKVIQIVTESARITVLTAHGHMWQGHRSAKEEGTGIQRVGWQPIVLPPECNSQPSEDHSEILAAVAAVITENEPYTPLGTKASARVWDLVKEFADAQA